MRVKRFDERLGLRRARGLHAVDHLHRADISKVMARRDAFTTRIFGERPREFLRAVRDRRRAVDRKSRADVALYKSSRPHAALDGRTPDAVYFAQSLRKIAA